MVNSNNNINEINSITEKIIGAAIEVHRNLGPGMLESAYEKCLLYELKLKDLKIESQIPVNVKYKEIIIDCAYRLDLLVEDKVIVELKAIDKVLPIHSSQLLTYMRFTNKKYGLLINFNENKLIDGLSRLTLAKKDEEL